MPNPKHDLDAAHDRSGGMADCGCHWTQWHANATYSRNAHAIRPPAPPRGRRRAPGAEWRVLSFRMPNLTMHVQFYVTQVLLAYVYLDAPVFHPSFSPQFFTPSLSPRLFTPSFSFCRTRPTLLGVKSQGLQPARWIITSR